MKIGAALLVVLAACWTSPPPPEAPAPRKPAVVRHVVKRPAPRKRTPSELNAELTVELRKSTTVLADLLDGPVVALDLDTGTIETLCGTAATTAAQSWGQLLADSNRRPAGCQHGLDGHFGCVQRGVFSDPLLMLELVYLEDGWHLLSVIVGSLPNRTQYYASRVKMDEVRARVETASCP